MARSDLAPQTQLFIELLEGLGDLRGRRRGWRKSVSELLGISPSYVSKLLKREREVGVEIADKALSRLGVVWRDLEPLETLRDRIVNGTLEINTEVSERLSSEQLFTSLDRCYLAAKEVIRQANTPEGIRPEAIEELDASIEDLDFRNAYHPRTLAMLRLDDAARSALATAFMISQGARKVAALVMRETS